MTAAILGEWARLLLGSLAQCGVKDVVVSPGSRSTPFTWAAAHTAGLTCHSLYDERSAAFFALGMARVTGKPALLVCTSGSAAANYFPAVVEASLANVPLLVMTADRPLELQDAGAPQTIDQVKLYGDFARSYFDLGVPDPAAESLAALQRIAAQAVLASTSPVPGPVHLNARARKPLEPKPPETEHELAVAAHVEGLLERGAPRAFGDVPAADPRGIGALAERLARAERGLIVCGPLAPRSSDEAEAIVELAKKLDMPLYAEATSQLRFGASVDAERAADAFDWLVRAPVAGRRFFPDVLLRFGATPVSAGVEQLLAAHGSTELLVVTEHGFSDPTSSASLVVRGAPANVARGVLERLPSHAPSAAQRAFRESVIGANEVAWGIVDGILDARGFERFGEAWAIRSAVSLVPERGLLMVGNSLPVREVDAYVRAKARGFSVLCQRGTNGIDGLVSGAAGACVASGRPVVLLVGDVSFAHDLSGLAAARRVDAPLVVVVIDNDGGRIFDQLPVAHLFSHEGGEPLSKLWLTPPELDLEHAGGLFRLPYGAPASLSELERELRAALDRKGASIVHVRVDPEGTRAYPPMIWQEVGKRLAVES
jgi:2-succinyl-5-enolpyruvyl-6-hydroxy-3-cyclohexene-1-carboxylate synthase